MIVHMKGITCCGDCAYYNLKKHYCTRAQDEGDARSRFYADCPLPDVTPVESQPPMVIRKDELAYIMPGAVVWYDEQTSEWSKVLMPICPVCVERVGITDWNGKQKVMIQYTDGYDDVADYGKGYRLWTARPTEEQRRGEPWSN